MTPGKDKKTDYTITPEIIVRAKAGNQKAKDILYNETLSFYQKKLRCSNIFGINSKVAEYKKEAVSQALNKVFRNLHKYDVKKYGAKSWWSLAHKYLKSSLADQKREKSKDKEFFINIDSEMIDTSKSFKNAVNDPSITEERKIRNKKVVTNLQNSDITTELEGVDSHINYNEDSFAFNETRKELFRKAAQIPGEWTKMAFLITFQNFETNQEDWSNLIGRKPSTFRSDINRAHQKFLEILDSSDNSDYLKKVIELYSIRGSKIFNLTPQEISLLKDPLKEQAITLAFDYSDPIVPAKIMNMNASDYKKLFINSFKELLGKLIDYRKISSDIFKYTSEDLAAWSPDYISMLKKSLYPAQGLRGSDTPIKYTSLHLISDFCFFMLSDISSVSSFAQKIQSDISKSGLTYEDICKKTEISSHTLVSWLNGSVIPSEKEINRLYSILDKTIED